MRSTSPLFTACMTVAGIVASAQGNGGNQIQPASTTITASTPSAPVPALRLVPPEAWPEIRDELHRKSLLKGAAKTIAYLKKLPDQRQFYRIGDKQVAVGELIDTAEEFVRIAKESATDEQFSSRLKGGFDLYQSVGSDGAGKVVFSSYYQPILQASSRRTEKYLYPIYRKPSDMVEVDLGLFNPKYKGDTLLGRLTKDKRLVPYFDRRDIDVRKVLAGRHLEIAWLANQFDRLDLHIQGSGILKLTNGRKVLAKYAATNALPYKSVGAAAVGSGALSRADISHERLRQYLTEHPEGESWLIAQNPRYTFFDLTPLPLDGEPFGTIQEPLTPGRSIAVDASVLPLGAVAYFQTPMPQADKDGNLLGTFPTSRFALAQDTGGAIQGPGRVDIYIGSGLQAKTSAVNQWSEGKLFILLKKIPPRDR